MFYILLGGGVKISRGGSKYRYDILTPGSKYRMIYWPRGQYIGGSKYRLTPVVIMAVNKIIRIRYHFSRACVTIGALHNQKSIMTSLAQHKRSECDTESILFLSSGICPLCRVRNEMVYALSWRTILAHLSVIYCLLFLLFATREINNKITLSWPHKEFATPTHT